MEAIIWLGLPGAALLGLLVVAVAALVARQWGVMGTALAVLVMLGLECFAYVGLWIQPEWRSREDTVTALTWVGGVGAAFIAGILFAIARAPWRQGVKKGAVAAVVAHIVAYSTVLAVLVDPGLRDAHLPEGVGLLHVFAWFATAAALAAAMLKGVLAPRRPLSSRA